MKKIFWVAMVLVGTALFAAGCNSATGVRNGFGYVAPALIYTQTAQGGAFEPNQDVLARPYVHLGRVSGESSASNVLLIISSGDASIEKAQNDALRKVKNADALINRVFDVRSFSIFGLFTTSTLVVTGDAVKFTSKP